MDEPKRWQGSEYAVSVTEKDGRHESVVLRREKGDSRFREVPGSRQQARTKAEARFLAEHRKQIVREGDSIH